MSKNVVKKRGRPAVVVGPDMLVPVLENVRDNGPVLTKNLGLSVHFMKKVRERGYLDSVPVKEENSGKGRPNFGWKLSAKGRKYLKETLDRREKNSVEETENDNKDSLKDRTAKVAEDFADVVINDNSVTDEVGTSNVSVADSVEEDIPSFLDRGV